MPQVPYKGYPEGGPQHVPLRPEIPEAGLLAGARATESLGRSLSGAGDEIFRTALKIKQDENETLAVEADAKYIVEAGRLRADFDSLQGEDRAKAYPKYQTDLNAARMRLRSELPNIDAQRRFDFSALRTMSHAVAAGGSAAATAQKQWTVNTAEANQAIRTQQVLENPGNSAIFDDNMKAVEIEARKAADARYGGGLKSTIADEAALKATSHVKLQRIQGMARTREGIEVANDWFQANKKGMTADDRIRAGNLIQTQATSIGAEIISDQVLEWGRETDVKAGRSKQEMDAEVKRLVQEKDPNGELPDLLQRTMGDFNRKYNQASHSRVIDRQTDEQSILGGVQQFGPISVEELKRKDPKVREILERDSPDKAKLTKYAEEAVNAWFKTKDYVANKKRYQELRSMASDNTEEFLSIPPSQWKVGPSDWKSLYSVREKAIKGNGTYDDPRVDKAMKFITDKYAETLASWGVDKQKDITTYRQFRGGLSVALDQWQEDNPGKKITSKDVIDTIFPQMRAEMQRPSKTMIETPFGNVPWPKWKGTSKIWQLEVPDDPDTRNSLKEIIHSRLPAGSPEPTEQELALELERQVWKSKFKKQKEK